MVKIYYIEAYDYDSMYTVAMFTDKKKAEEFYALAKRFYAMVKTIRDLDHKYRFQFLDSRKTEPYDNVLMIKAIHDWEDSNEAQAIKCFQECLGMFRDIYGLEDWYSSCGLRSMETS